MNERKQDASPLLPESDRSIISRILGVWLAFLFGAFFLAIEGLFTDNAVLFLSLAALVGILISLRTLRPSKELALVGAILFVFVFLISFPSSPSVFSGRDQGSYAGAAIRLAHEYSLHSHIPEVAQDFFHIYGAGKSLNIPGFFFAPDGSLVTQFPLGNIAWLGANVSLFGVVGLSLANAFTLFLSLLILFAFLRLFLPFQFAFGGFAVAALSFPFVWIQERTLSENLALPLFLALSFYVVSFLKEPQRWSWWMSVLLATFLSLTRIEGFALLAVAVLIVFFRKESRDYLLSHFFTTVFPAIGIVGAIIGVDIQANLPFYITMGKAALESFSVRSNISPPSSSSPLSIIRTFEVFWTYGMISVTSLALLGLTFLIRRRAYIHLTPLWLALPTFVYLLSPQISSDHPWMLRRFVFAFWPAVIILAIFSLAILHEFFENRFPGKTLVRPAVFSACFCTLLILPALPTTVPRLFFAENKNLLADIETLSSNFSNKDLVLVDRLSSGDSFSMIADPMSTLFGKNAIYFFNPSDLSRIDIAKFEHVYLIAKDGDENTYRTAFGSRFELQRIKPYTLRTSLFSREADPSRIPLRSDAAVSGSIFLIVPSA